MCDAVPLSVSPRVVDGAVRSGKALAEAGPLTKRVCVSRERVCAGPEGATDLASSCTTTGEGCAPQSRTKGPWGGMDRVLRCAAQINHIQSQTATGGTPFHFHPPRARQPARDKSRDEDRFSYFTGPPIEGTWPDEQKRAMFRSSLALRALAARTSVTHVRQSVRYASLLNDQSANIGDYPTEIPAVNRQTRSEVVKWDNQQDRRNFNETVLFFPKPRRVFARCAVVSSLTLPLSCTNRTMSSPSSVPTSTPTSPRAERSCTSPSSSSPCWGSSVPPDSHSRPSRRSGGRIPTTVSLASPFPPLSSAIAPNSPPSLGVAHRVFPSQSVSEREGEWEKGTRSRDY